MGQTAVLRGMQERPELNARQVLIEQLSSESLTAEVRLLADGYGRSAVGYPIIVRWDGNGLAYPRIGYVSDQCQAGCTVHVTV